MLNRLVNHLKRAIFLAVTLAVVPSALADWELNMPQGVTSITREIFTLHMLILWVCVAIAVLVFGAMIYSIINHRASKNPEPATFTHSTKAEIIWTAIPVVILIAMALPSAKTLVAIEDAAEPDMTIKITAYQWKWHYEYLEEEISFFSSLSAESNRIRQLGSGLDPNAADNYLLEVDNRLVVPVDKKVRLLLTARDVIHAWWVPELTGKRDAIPGFVNQLWFSADTPGVYRGQCAELCGRDHGFMPIVVEVKSEADYAAWLSGQGAAAQEDVKVAEAPVDTAQDLTDADLMARGEEVYGVSCLACHQTDGMGLPPAFPPLAGSAVATGDVEGHISTVVKGRAGTAMVGFGPQLSDVELAAVVTYTRNAFGNETGDLVRPADIAAAR